MLTVACVWIKSEIYQDRSWVDKLYWMVKRNLPVDYKYNFMCVTPHVNEFWGEEPAIGCEIPIIIPGNGYRAWWYKLNLFNLQGDRILYLDLDTVIHGDLTKLIDFPSDFVVCPSSGVPMRKHDFNSSIMVWNPASPQIQTVRSLLRSADMKRYSGDQQWLSSLPIRVDLFPSRWIHKYLPGKGVYEPEPETIATLLIQGGKNEDLVKAGHSWIERYWH